jgi:hypothetical protein
MPNRNISMLKIHTNYFTHIGKKCEIIAHTKQETADRALDTRFLLDSANLQLTNYGRSVVYPVYYINSGLNHSLYVIVNGTVICYAGFSSVL